MLNDSGTMSGIASVIKLIADNLTLVVPIVAEASRLLLPLRRQVIGLNAAVAQTHLDGAVCIGAVIGLIAQFGDEDRYFRRRLVEPV